MINFLIVIFIAIVLVIIILKASTNAYQNWLKEVKHLSKFYGFTEEHFAKIDEEIWTAYYDWHLEPEAAIKKYLSEY